MRKVFFVVALSILCIGGCRKNDREISDISSTLIVGKEIDNNFYKETLGEPDSNINGTLVWNNYELVKNYLGTLTTWIYEYPNSTKIGIASWMWTCVGTKDDYFKIHQIFTTQYGKAIPIRDDNTWCAFQIEDDPRGNNEYTYEAELRYDTENNTINFSWPYF